MNYLYAVIIFPIEQIIEVVYILIDKVFGVPGISIIGVSFAVTFLALPLYIIAEKWQETERQTTNKLKPKINRIKQAFKGDEQYMILSAYYRQNGYHPLYSLRNSLNILIQIPFFIAAYRYLSNLSALQGESFLFLKDLSKPDALFKIGAGGTINALPVVMTAANCISGAIYTKNLALRDKLQVYIIAFIFLILLYNSPSGLVLYWTINNVFSLIKNVFYKLKNPLKLLYLIISAFAVLFICYLLFLNGGAQRKRMMLSFFCLFIPFVPVFLKLYIRLRNYFMVPLMGDGKNRLFLFSALCAVLTALTGLCIPSSVIASSPEEFSFIDAYQSPLPFVVITFFKSVGFFIFWPFCIYIFFGKKVQSFLTLLFWAAVTGALVNNFVFQKNFSTISNTFTFDNSLIALNASKTASVFSLFLTLTLFTAFLFLIRYKRVKIISTFLVLLFFSLTSLSAYNIYTIQNGYVNFAALKKTGLSDISRIKPVFHLSKDKPNIIIMSDRAINGFVKPIFDEHPDLYDKFDGFTLFPNTLSFADHTLVGISALWGGYEYTPKEMNLRDKTPLVDKHNEALLVLPKILSETGYQVTVTDPSWANYASTNDVSIYDKYENIQAFNTIGRYSYLWYSINGFENVSIKSDKIKRNALWFSFLKISPPFIRKTIHDEGDYWEAEKTETIETFVNSYAVLDFLPELTAYDSEKPSALLLTNETTHESLFLQYPSYTPVRKVTNTGYGAFSDKYEFHVNSAAYLKIGEWLEELKRNNVYDNSRIIIVSDHGAIVNAGITDTELTIQNERREKFNPVLLVKNFNSRGRLQTDMTFMTNADVPVLALDGIAETINPFTGKSLRENPKSQGLYITTTRLWHPNKHSKNKFNINADHWLFVHDNIFDPNNWEKAEK